MRPLKQSCPSGGPVQSDVQTLSTVEQYDTLELNATYVCGTDETSIKDGREAGDGPPYSHGLCAGLIATPGLPTVITTIVTVEAVRYC